MKELIYRWFSTEVFTYSEARQRFADLLDQAQNDGKVLIKRKDGSLFALVPEASRKSPLDVKGVKTKASTSDIINALRETRGRFDE